MDLKKLLKKAADIKDKAEDIKDKAEDAKDLLDGGVDIKEIVTKFISSKKDGAAIDGDTDLFESGFVNSMFALEIVTFIEKTFKIKLDKKDITKENFSSVNKIVALVKKLIKK